jgi:hypothetical protein
MRQGLSPNLSSTVASHRVAARTGKEATAMSSNQVAARALPSVQTNALAIAAFVLSLMGMYGSRC